MLRVLTFFVGILFMIVAILGFMPEFINDGKFLGIFAINSINNIAHLATGVIALLCSLKSSWACSYFFIALGIIYGLLAVLGLFDSSMTLFKYITTNAANNFFHAVLALIAFYIGILSLRK